MVTIVQGAKWAPRPVRTNAGKLAPNGIRSPELPVSKKIKKISELIYL
jgi:hypothetical protein